MNKICIGMMYQYDDHWLRLHVPKLAEAGLPFVFLNGNGEHTEIDDFLMEYGAVFYRRFEWNFADQQNYLNECAEQMLYDAIIKLDPDELMYPNHLRLIADQIGSDYNAACLPRYNFVHDREHVCLDWFPDLQTRVWLLGYGVEWRGQHHATAAGSIRELGWGLERLEYPIYHYKWISSRKSCTLSRINYDRTKDGLGPLVELPEGAELCEIPDGERFEYAQPMDPNVIGVRAPW